MKNNIIMNDQYYPIKNSFIRLDRKIQSVLYEPVEPNEKSQISVIVMHSEGDFLTHSAGSGLAKRGYRVLCANVSNRDNPLDEKLPDVKVAVEYLRQYLGLRKVILLGHSGGATLISAYQNVAENGVRAFQGPEKLIRCSDVGELLPADGVMLLDSNYGNGAMTLLSLDPAVTSEDNGKILDPELDLFNPDNGYNPNGSTYSDEFIQKFQKAQGERNNRLIDAAVERLHAIESGNGKYADDEPFIVPGGAVYSNKLIPQDIRLLSHTRKAWPLLHADGSITTQVVPSVRRVKKYKSLTTSYLTDAIKSTVRTYLNSWAVRTTGNFGYNEDSIQGIDWLSSYNCTPGNMMGVSAPLLVMGMTGNYEYLAAEIIYENTKNTDKAIVFVEGATHEFTTAKDCEKYPGQFGDTEKTLYDYVDKWLSQKGRFTD
jgi:hypothetical protein